MSIEDLSAKVSRPGGPGAGTPAFVADDVGVFRWSTRLKQRIQILEDFNITIGAGEHWAVLGPNGAGKTTCFYSVMGLVRPDSGRILLDGVDIGRHARVRRAIIDKHVHIPPGTEIGFDPEHDRARGFTVSEGGVVVIAKADGVDHFLEPQALQR